ncbi:hypothetical protein BLOT_014520 [Blomia tropicalis]|nr:hypothetical protein BLOT_014520 [Blomia tropicalis]
MVAYNKIFLKFGFRLRNNYLIKSDSLLWPIIALYNELPFNFWQNNGILLGLLNGFIGDPIKDNIRLTRLAYGPNNEHGRINRQFIIQNNYCYLYGCFRTLWSGWKWNISAQIQMGTYCNTSHVSPKMFGNKLI